MVHNWKNNQKIPPRPEHMQLAWVFGFCRHQALTTSGISLQRFRLKFCREVPEKA